MQSTHQEPEKLLKKLLEINSMIYIGLSVLEQNIRTAMTSVLRAHLGAGWLVDNITPSGIPLFQQEADLIMRRKGTRFVLTEKKFLEECSMGFWVELFNPETYKLLKGIPIQAFTNRPAFLKRKEIYTRMKALKDLRNNLVHNRLQLETDHPGILALTATLKTANAETRELLSYLNPAAIRLLPTGIERRLESVKKLAAAQKS